MADFTAISRLPWRAAHLSDACVFRKAVPMPGKGSLHSWPIAPSACPGQRRSEAVTRWPSGLKRQICFPRTQTSNPFLRWAQLTQVSHQLSFQNTDGKCWGVLGRRPVPSWSSVPALQGPGEMAPPVPCTSLPTKSPILGLTMRCTAPRPCGDKTNSWRHQLHLSDPCFLLFYFHKPENPALPSCKVEKRGGLGTGLLLHTPPCHVTLRRAAAEQGSASSYLSPEGLAGSP